VGLSEPDMAKAAARKAAESFIAEFLLSRGQAPKGPTAESCARSELGPLQASAAVPSFGRHGGDHRLTRRNRSGGCPAGNLSSTGWTKKPIAYLALNKDAPVSRLVQCAGVITCHPWRTSSPLRSDLGVSVHTGTSKNRHTRDFWRHSIFDFFNSIGARRTFAKTTRSAKRHHGTLPRRRMCTGPPKRFFRPQASDRHSLVPCPASSCERAYAMHLF
jgi:hypothetical protein